MRIEFLMSMLMLSVLSGCINTDKYQEPKNETHLTNTPVQINEPHITDTPNYPLRKVSDKVELYQDDKWEVGDGYVLTAYIIDDNTISAWLTIEKDGVYIGECIGPEGHVCNFQNKFKTTINKVYYKNETTNAVILTDTMIYP